MYAIRSYYGLATRIARVLRGKHKPEFTPHLDTGDYVVVVNAEKIRLTGRKATNKTYFRHSGYMGGERHVPITEVMAKRPERVIELAVKGMLPKNNLGRLMRNRITSYNVCYTKLLRIHGLAATTMPMGPVVVVNGRISEHDSAIEISW